MNLNTAHLIGRVTRDPELKTLPSGTNVVKFGLATNHTFKDKSGAKQETAQFHNCVAFGKVAEIIGQYVKKGQEIYVQGRIEYRTWDAKDGTKRTGTEIMVDQLQMGSHARGGGQEASGEENQAGGQLEAENGATGGVKDEDEEINPEDIPF